MHMHVLSFQHATALTYVNFYCIPNTPLLLSSPEAVLLGPDTSATYPDIVLSVEEPAADIGRLARTKPFLRLFLLYT